MDPTFPLVPFLNLLACVLILCSVSGGMFRSWNIGVCLYALWTFLGCLTIAVNTIIWSDNARNVAPVWCDITTHIAIGYQAAIAACTFIISRRLFMISRLRAVDNSRSRRVEIIFDISLGIGLPVIVMALYYIVQLPRFVIIEDFGCASAYAGSASGLALLLIQSWSLVLPVASILLYGIRILWTFYHQRKEINEFLASGSVGRSNYMRVMMLGGLDTIITLPVNTVNILATVLQGPIPFWSGWDAVHSDWDPVSLSRKKWTSQPLLRFGIIWSEVVPALLAFLFFALFGLTRENRLRYLRYFWMILRPLGIKPRESPRVSNIIFGSMVIVDPARSYMNTIDFSRQSSEQELKPIRESSSATLVSENAQAAAENGEAPTYHAH